MKTRDAELLIVRAQLETARLRVKGLESEERELLAFGADPRMGRNPVALTTEDPEKLMAYLSSPAFLRKLQKQGKVLLGAIDKRAKGASGKWKPLASSYRLAPHQ